MLKGDNLGVPSALNTRSLDFARDDDWDEDAEVRVALCWRGHRVRRAFRAGATNGGRRL